MPPMLGRLELYVTTIGILLVVLLGRGVNASSLHGFQSHYPNLLQNKCF